MFVHISKAPSRAQRFGDAMRYFQTRPGLKISHVVDGYDWASVRRDGNSECTVVDVGGLSRSARYETRAKVCVYSMCGPRSPETVKQAIQVPSGLEGRVRFMEHGIFLKQPFVGVEVYTLRWILHDWLNGYAVKLFQALAAVLRLDSKIFVDEICMPAVGSLSPCEDTSIRYGSSSRSH